MLQSWDSNPQTQGHTDSSTIRGGAEMSSVSLIAQPVLLITLPLPTLLTPQNIVTVAENIHIYTHTFVQLNFHIKLFHYNQFSFWLRFIPFSAPRALSFRASVNPSYVGPCQVFLGLHRCRPGPQSQQVFPALQNSSLHWWMKTVPRHSWVNTTTSVFLGAILPRLSQLIFNTEISLVTTMQEQIFPPPWG